MSGYKGPYQEAKKLAKHLEQQVATLTEQVATLQGDIATNQADFERKLEEKESEIETLTEEKEGAEEELEATKETLKITEVKLRDKELNRFAEQYLKQEERYRDQQKEWMWYSLGAAGLLLTCVVGTVIIGSLSDDTFAPEVIFLNVVLLTIFLYCLRQHSHLANLRDDYANRKALAQSYQYMAQGDEADGLEDIRVEFFKKATETFTRRPASRGNDVSIQDALMSKFFGQNGK